MKGVPFLPKLVYRRVVKMSKAKPLNKKLQVVEHPQGFVTYDDWFFKSPTVVCPFEGHDLGFTVRDLKSCSCSQ